MKKRFIVWHLMLSVVLLFPGMAGAMYASDEASADEFGNCYADPVYDADFYASPKVYLNVRNTACMDGSTVIGVLDPAKIYRIVAKTDGWYKVKLADGTQGWAGASLLTKTTTAEETADEPVVEEVAATDTSSIVSRVKGYILLQVEEAGEAWYVNPVDENRYYLKDGDAAFAIMRNFGLGVSNADLQKLLAGDYSLTDRLKGRIVLAVQKNGEAYYVNPKDRSVHYLQNGGEAYKIMRNLSLGITNQNLEKIKFKNKIEKVTAQKNAIQSNNEQGAIVLSAKEDAGKVKLSWELQDMSSDLGFKIVVSENLNPVYPGNDYHYLSDKNVRDDTWSGLTAGKTYYFRVCEYLGGKCGVYSNNVKITLSEEKENDSGSISLTASKLESNKVALTWSLDGWNADMGFKVVVDTEPNPVYPGNDYHYLSNKDVRTDTWSGLTAGKTYYFRVCEYLGGKCGVYSNNVEINL